MNASVSLRRRIHKFEKIHTFKSFHADMMLLEACYKPLHRLWPKGNDSLGHICQASFEGDAEDFEQIREVMALRRPELPETGRAGDVRLRLQGRSGHHNHITISYELGSGETGCVCRSTRTHTPEVAHLEEASHRAI